MADFTTGGAKAQNADVFIGKELGKYEVKEKLGQGAMGIVLKVKDTLEDVYKAIKMVPPEVAFDKLSFNQLKQEVNVSSKISHPNVIKVMGLEEFQGLFFIVMEYVEGETLADKLADSKNRKLPEKDVMEYFKQSCNGLAEAHRRGVIHLDLKPQNIMVTKDGEVKILDFSISHQITKSMTMLTGQNLSTGTLPYMAPEQLSKKYGKINEQTDVWGLAATMYHLLSGDVPFEDRNQIIDPEEEPYELEDVSDLIKSIINGCMLKDRTKRFKNIAELMRVAGFTMGDSQTAENLIDKPKRSKEEQSDKKGDLSITTNIDCSIIIKGQKYKTEEKYLFISDLQYEEIEIVAETDELSIVQKIKIDKKLTKISLDLKEKLANLYAKSKIGKFELKINDKTYSCPELIEKIPSGNYKVEIVFNKEVYLDNIELNKSGTIEYELTKEKLTNMEKKSIVSPSDLDLSEDQVKKLLKKKNFYDLRWNENGDFKNDFKSETINGDLVITDKATNLMWHQSGSQKNMNWSKAKEWVLELNKKGYAGYSDWRLPTLEEGASLLTKKKKFFGLYIDEVFHKKQKWIWTGDSFGSGRACTVYFVFGSVYWDNVVNFNYVRPVRL